MVEVQATRGMSTGSAWKKLIKAPETSAPTRHSLLRWLGMRMREVRVSLAGDDEGERGDAAEEDEEL